MQDPGLGNFLSFFFVLCCLFVCLFLTQTPPCGAAVRPVQMRWSHVDDGGGVAFGLGCQTSFQVPSSF